MAEISFAEIKSLLNEKYAAKIRWHESEVLRLTAEREAALAAITASENTLEEIDVQAAPKPHRTKFPRNKSDSSPTTISAKDRITEQLVKISGDFGRMELFERVNNDGNDKEVKVGTFGIYFAELVKEGKIITVQKSIGNNPAAYRKSSESQDTFLPGMNR